MHKPHLMGPRDFLSLVLLKMTYGQLHGVFAPSSEQLFDVFLPDRTADDGRSWIAQLHVPPGVTVEQALLKLHERLVLSHWHRFRQEIRERGVSLLDPPVMSLVRMYRYVDYDSLATAVGQALRANANKPYYGKSALSYPVFEASPCMSDVSVRVVGARRVLHVTNEDGVLQEAIALGDMSEAAVLQATMAFLRGQQIAVINEPKALQAA